MQQNEIVRLSAECAHMMLIKKGSSEAMLVIFIAVTLSGT
jgi:hypothetical protein